MTAADAPTGPAPAALAAALPDGLVAIVKADCPTCRLVEPVLHELAAGDERLTVVTQDDPSFPAVDPADVEALTACIDFVVERL